jgi:hypothetical protein
MNPWVVLGWIFVVGFGYFIGAFVLLTFIGMLLDIARAVGKAKVRRRRRIALRRERLDSMRCQWGRVDRKAIAAGVTCRRQATHRTSRGVSCTEHLPQMQPGPFFSAKPLGRSEKP